MEKIQHEDGSTEEKGFYDDQLDHIYFNDKDGRVYKHQQFRNGQLESTSFYDKDGIL